MTVCSECGKPIEDPAFPVCNDCLRNRPRPIRTVEDLRLAVKDQLEQIAEDNRELEEMLDLNDEVRARLDEGTPVSTVRLSIARFIKEHFTGASGDFYGSLSASKDASKLEMSGKTDYKALNITRKLAKKEELRKKQARGEPLTKKERKVLGEKVERYQPDADLSDDLISRFPMDPMEITRIMLKRQIVQHTVPRERESRSALKRHRRKIRRIEAVLDAACRTILVWTGDNGETIRVSAGEISGIRERAIEVARHAMGSRPTPSRNPSILAAASLCAALEVFAVRAIPGTPKYEVVGVPVGPFNADGILVAAGGKPRRRFRRAVRAIIEMERLLLAYEGEMREDEEEWEEQKAWIGLPKVWPPYSIRKKKRGERGLDKFPRKGSRKRTAIDRLKFAETHRRRWRRWRRHVEKYIQPPLVL